MAAIVLVGLADGDKRGAKRALPALRDDDLSRAGEIGGHATTRANLNPRERTVDSTKAPFSAVTSKGTAVKACLSRPSASPSLSREPSLTRTRPSPIERAVRPATARESRPLL